jgi:hypothetical protein
MSRIAAQVLAVALLVAGIPNTAHAYIDPGSASLWLQGLIAMVTGVVAFASVTWGRIKSLLSRFLKRFRRNGG